MKLTSDHHLLVFGISTVVAFLKNTFIYLFVLFLAMLGLCCCAGFFSSCGKWGLLSSCCAWASHRGGFSCCGVQAAGHMGFSSCSSQASERGLWSCGAWAWLLCSVWIFPDQGQNPCLLHWQETCEPPKKLFPPFI